MECGIIYVIYRNIYIYQYIFVFHILWTVFFNKGALRHSPGALQCEDFGLVTTRHAAVRFARFVSIAVRFASRFFLFCT